MTSWCWSYRFGNLLPAFPPGSLLGSDYWWCKRGRRDLFFLPSYCWLPAGFMSAPAPETCSNQHHSGFNQQCTPIPRAVPGPSSHLFSTWADSASLCISHRHQYQWLSHPHVGLSPMGIILWALRQQHTLSGASFWELCLLCFSNLKNDSCFLRVLPPWYFGVFILPSRLPRKQLHP